jgi:hypothetical protein
MKLTCINGHPYTPENTYRSGGQYACKQCKKNYNDKLLDDHYEKYEKRREYQRNYQLTHKYKTTKRIQDILDYIKQCKTKCVYCSESHPACLDFHHRNPNEKSFGMGKAHLCQRSLDTVKTEIAKCDIVCSNCHRKFHASLKEIE